jgi:nucleotide-binding universal stress UspA family protein
MGRFRSIIVPTDFSTASQAVTDHAAKLASLDGASVHLVHAVSFPLIATAYEISVPAPMWEGVRQAARENLEEIQKTIEGKGVQTVTAELSNSRDPVAAIEDATEAHAGDLIVMGTHGHSGLKHAFLGSIAERTIRNADCPVLAVKGDAVTPIARILLAVDFSIHSNRAVDLAAGLAKRLAASVDVVHAFGLPADYTPYASHFGTDLEQKIQTCASDRLDSIRDRLERDEVPVTLHFRRGLPSLVIAEVAEETRCQLIVMGTRGNSGLSHVLLGSVAERTLRAAPCSVLVVKADDRTGDP